jgi:hypothetical protein
MQFDNLTWGWRLCIGIAVLAHIVERKTENVDVRGGVGEGALPSMAPAAGELNGGALRGISRRASFGIALALLSFLIYVCTIFALPQLQNARYCCEQSSVAAGVSNVVYGTPLGSLYSGVFDFFNHFDEPLERALEKAQAPGARFPTAPPGELFKTTRDGNGVGYPLIATVAFRLFGLHAWALTLTMLVLMALSAVAFLLRFSSAAFVGVVILYFSVLTVMLFTPLVWDPFYALQIPVGGIRYFSLVSVLPIFHIQFTLLDPHAIKLATGRRRNAVLLGLQTAVLMLTMLVRGSAPPLLGAIALVWVALAWRRRRNPGARRALIDNAAVIGLVSVGVLGAIAVSVPSNYVTEGRFGTVIWHRVTGSLGLNPSWPFPRVNDMFDCKKYIPEGIQRGTPDTNGHCIWLDYVFKHNIPIETIGDKTYGSLYEAALRQAFFKIAARYPGETLKTFVYYKPRYTVWSIAQSLRFNFAADQAMAVNPAGPRVVSYPPLAVGLLLFSLGVALAYFSIETVTFSDIARIAGVTLLSALFTLPAYFAVWAVPYTSADLLLYCLFACGLALSAIPVSVRGRPTAAPEVR